MVRVGRLGPEPSGNDGSPDFPALDPYLVNLETADLTSAPDAQLAEILRLIADGEPAATGQAHAVQVETDRRMVAVVRADGFEGPRFDRLLFGMYEYAYPVMAELVHSGKIFGQCQRLNRSVTRRDGDVEWTAQTRDQLTQESVDEGVFYVFREHGLKRSLWTPGGGATLTTYACNACIREFPHVYNRWWRGQVLVEAYGNLEAALPAEQAADRRFADPEHHAVTLDEVTRLMSQIDEPVRTALILRAQGLNQAEAASAVGLTEKALEGRLGRTRQRLGLVRQPRPQSTNPTNPEGVG